MGAQAGWNNLDRSQKIAALAHAKGVERQCPSCGRMVHVVGGYWSQHSDPTTWVGRRPVRQCENELTPYATSDD